MDVVAHQAVAEGCHAGRFTALLEEGEVGPAIVVNEEDILAVVAALRNVMGVVRHNYSSDSRHARMLPPAARHGNK
jgi:hypothetical protein